MAVGGRPPFGPIPVKMPARDFFAGGFSCVEVPNYAIGVIIAALDGLKYRGSWYGEEELINTACLQMETTIANLNITLACGNGNGNGNGNGDGTGGVPGNGASSYLEECEDEMPGITWLEIGEDGKLYMYFGPCCKVEVKGDFLATIVNPPDDPADDPEEPPTWACNKARGIAAAIVIAMVALDDAIGGIGSVYDMYAPAHAVLQPLGATWQTTQLVCGAFVADAAVIQEMINGAETEDWLACTWSGQLADTDSLNGDELFSLKTVHPPGFTDSQRLFMMRIVSAVANTTLQWWARLFHDSAADCTCPDTGGGATEPTESGWYFSAPEVQRIVCPGGFDQASASWFDNLSHDIYGVYLRWDWISGADKDKLKRANDDQGWTNYDLYMFDTNSENRSFAADYMQIGEDAYAEISPLFGNPARLTGGEFTDDIENPSLEAGLVALAHLQGTADGDPAEMTVDMTFRWLHNINSPSHS